MPPSKISVVWYSRYQTHDHPAGHRVIPRFYWDQAWLEAIFDQSLWEPPGGYTFVHGQLNVAAGGGAVVVIPARWHADDIDAINDDLSRISWALVVLCGDEEGVFPHDKLTHPNMAIWVQTPHPSRHADIPLHRRVGDLFPPNCRDIVSGLGMDHPRALNWFFAGQENHIRRKELVYSLQRRLNRGHIDGELLSTRVFGSGYAYPDYMRMLASSKVAPCPSGLFTPDSFRVFEALEAGCIPIVDSTAPNNANDQGYWEFLFGEDPPFPVVHQWRNVGNMIDILSGEEWLPTSNRIQAWWAGKKRKVAHSFHDDIEQLSGSRAYSTVADRLTVILVTSPTVTNPDTSHIEQTVASIRAQADLVGVEILLCIDGVRPEQERLRGSYDEYIRRLLWMAQHDPEWFNVCPLLFPTHQHQANMTRVALQEVRTPSILFMEHDTPLVGNIPWSELVDAVTSRRANLIRLHHEASILEPHRHLMLDSTPRDDLGIPAMRTAQWSQRPHVTSTVFYKAILDRFFSPAGRTMIEDVMHGVVNVHFSKFGETGWRPFNMWMYTPPGDIKRSTHLDTRGEEPKWASVIEYPKDTPFGAPRATSELQRVMAEFAAEGRQWE